MAHLLIIDLPGGNDTDIIEAARRRGDAFTFLTSQLDLYRSQPAVARALSAAHECIEVPSFHDDEVMERVLSVHARRRIDALLCLIDIRLPQAARIARALGARFLDPTSAALLRDKFAVRQRLAACGLAQPDFALAESNEELRAAVERLGLPVLIKPTDGYGSQNIVALRQACDLDPLLSPLQDMLPSRADYGLGVQANDRLLVERFMEGSFIGCDTMTAHGQHRLIGIHHKLMFEPPSFAIRGSSFTPRSVECDPVERYVSAVLDAVGFDWGAAHLEIMLTAEGPQLVEINPRLVGAKIARLVRFATGQSPHDELIELHLCRTVISPLPAAVQVGAIRWIVAERSGVLEDLTLPEPADARIRCVEILKQPGDRVQPPMENADRIGFVMACAPTRQSAEEAAERFVTQVVVRLRSSMA